MPRKKIRVLIPNDVAARVLFEADRTCCVCRQRKPVQIHHIDEDPANNSFDNLAVLCFDCHRETQILGGFDRKLDDGQVRLYRRDWLTTVQRVRAIAPDSPMASTDTPISLAIDLARLDIARDEGDWLTVARIYDAAGDVELRDKYITIALEENPRPFYRVLYARLQGTLGELPQGVRDAAADDVRRDWTSYASILFDVGRTEEAITTWLDGIAECVAEGKWFTAAYYIRHGLNARAADRLWGMALQEAAADGNLWWQLRCYEELGWTSEAKSLLLDNAEVIRATGRLRLRQKLAIAEGNDDDLLRLTKEIDRGGVEAYFDTREVNVAPTNSAGGASQDRAPQAPLDLN